MIDHHVGVVAGRVASEDDTRLVIKFQRVGHGEKRPRPGPRPEGLVIANTPIQDIFVTGLLQYVRRYVRRRQVRGEPTGRRGTLIVCNQISRGADRLGLLRLTHISDPL